MEYIATLPYTKYGDKQIAIYDAQDEQAGFIQRYYKNIFDKLFHYIPIFFLHKTNIYGESDGVKIKFVERSFKDNLKKLKWDVLVNDEPHYLEDKTKIATNIRMVYHKGDKQYIFKKDMLNNVCEVVNESEQSVCAEIILKKRIPAIVKVRKKSDALTLPELLGVYFMIYLVY